MKRADNRAFIGGAVLALAGLLFAGKWSFDRIYAPVSLQQKLADAASIACNAKDPSADRDYYYAGSIKRQTDGTYTVRCKWENGSEADGAFVITNKGDDTTAFAFAKNP